MLLETNDEDSGSQTKVEFAMDLLAPRKLQSEKDNEQQENNRLSFVSVIDYLWRNPQDCGSCEQLCQKRAAEDWPTDTTEHFAKVSVFSSLDKDWNVTFLFSRSKMSKGFLEHSCHFDPGTIDQLFTFNGIMPGLKLSEQCKHKAVLQASLTEVFKLNGDRILEWTDDVACCGPHDGIHWPSVGVYHLEFEAVSDKLKLGFVFARVGKRQACKSGQAVRHTAGFCLLHTGYFHIADL